MPQQVQGVVARSKGAPVELVEINIPDPGPNDVVVRIQACGVCHTDLTYRDGGINDDFPFLLGHEAAGIVEHAGSAVTHVEVGDFVVLNWRAVCGRCRACRRGRPWYCFDTFNASQPMTLADGTELTPALGIGAFADKTLVHERQCTRVDPNADPAVVGLLGCGVMAGLGAAMNTGNVSRGDSVAVIGCGGVGDAAIAGARLAGASPIIAIDRDPKKLQWATELGATHTIDASQADPVEAVQELTGGFGADVVVDAVGRPETWKQAFYARDLPAPSCWSVCPLRTLTLRDAAHRLLLPRRRAEVVVVRRLPARARFSGARRPLPAGSPAAGEVRQRAHQAGPGRGGVRDHAPRRGAAFGGRAVSQRIARGS